MTGYESKKKAAQDKLESMERKALKLALEALIAATPVKAKDPQMQAVAIVALQEALAQPAQERNFCERCGKRTADLTVIHTCTPPQEKNT